MPLPIEKVKLICPYCSSRQIQTRIDPPGRWCRRCGYQGKPEEFEAKEVKQKGEEKSKG